MKRHNKIFELLIRKRYIKTKVMLPIGIYSRILRIYHLVAINYMTYRETWNLLIGFAIDILDEIVFFCKVDRYFDILKIIDRTKYLLRDLINCGIYGRPLIKLYDYFTIKYELEEKRKMSNQQISNFFVWMEKYHYDSFKNHLFIHTNKIDEYLFEYERNLNRDA